MEFNALKVKQVRRLTDKAVALSFEIPKELDKEDFSPEKMGEIILNYWRDKKFAEAMKRNIIKLMEISKKNKTDNYNYDGKISENIYEMF